MKKSILKLGKALDKKEQKEVNGGSLTSFCQYTCSGTTARLASGSSTYCLLNYPAIIRDSPMCGGGGGGIDIWA